MYLSLSPSLSLSLSLSLARALSLSPPPSLSLSLSLSPPVLVNATPTIVYNMFITHHIYFHLLESSKQKHALTSVPRSMLFDFACYEDVLRARCWRIWQRKTLAFLHRNVLQLWSFLTFLPARRKVRSAPVRIILTSLWHIFDICIVPMKWDTKTSSHFFRNKTNAALGMVRPDFQEDTLLWDFCCKNVVDESDKSLSSEHVNDEVHSLQLCFARYFLQMYPPT